MWGADVTNKERELIWDWRISMSLCIIPHVAQQLITLGVALGVGMASVRIYSEILNYLRHPE